MTDVPCTNPDCDHTVKDGYLCWPCTHHLHSLLQGIAYTTRRRGIGTVLQPDDRDAIRDGIDGTNYRLDTLREPLGAGPGILEDLDVTIARTDSIPYRPSPLTRTCREVGCSRPAETPDGYCGSCGDYLTPAAKAAALVSPATRARDHLVNTLTTWARRLSEESGVHEAAAAARTAVDAAMATAGTAAERHAALRAAELADANPGTLLMLRTAYEREDAVHQAAHTRQVASVEHAARLTPPPMPHTISWLAGSVRAVRGRARAGEMLTEVQAALDQATRVIDRPDHVVRIDCPRCGRKIPVLPDAVTECRSCRGDGTEDGQRMFGDAKWWASQVAPAGQYVEVDYLQLVMPSYGYDDLHPDRMRGWVDRGQVPVESTAVKPNGRTVRMVDPAKVAATAARMLARRRPVRAVTR